MPMSIRRSRMLCGFINLNVQGGTKMFTKILSSVAPALGALFGFPKVGQAVNEVLGLSENSTEAERKKAIQAMTPEQKTELTRINKMYEAQLARIDHKNNELIVKDAQSARKMATKTNSSMPSILSFIMIFGYLVVIALIFLQPHLSHNDIFDIILGGLFATVTSIIHFWFGFKPKEKK